MRREKDCKGTRTVSLQSFFASGQISLKVRTRIKLEIALLYHSTYNKDICVAAVKKLLYKDLGKQKDTIKFHVKCKF